MTGPVYAPPRAVLMQAMAYGAEGDPAIPVTEETPFPVRGGNTPRIRAAFTIAADNTAYTAGDHIANHATGANVVPMLFALPRPSGRISGARVVLTAASGTIALPAMDLLLFRPAAGVPFATGAYPGDNAAMNIAGAAMEELVGVFPLTATSWRTQLGATSAAGLSAYQPTVPVLRPFAPFNVRALMTDEETIPPLIGVFQAQSAWNKGNVAYSGSVVLDVDAD